MDENKLFIFSKDEELFYCLLDLNEFVLINKKYNFPEILKNCLNMRIYVIIHLLNVIYLIQC
jgi:hypothetical protein